MKVQNKNDLPNVSIVYIALSHPGCFSQLLTVKGITSGDSGDTPPVRVVAQDTYRCACGGVPLQRFGGLALGRCLMFNHTGGQGLCLWVSMPPWGATCGDHGERPQLPRSCSTCSLQLRNSSLGHLISWQRQLRISDMVTTQNDWAANIFLKLC